MDFSRLEKKGIKNIAYFAKGKRGFVYIGIYKGKRVAIKIKNPKSEPIGRIKNEAEWLKILNKHKIGPKFIMFMDDKLIYEFVEGDFILDYIKNNNKENIMKILKNIFYQMYKLDRLKVNKEEMHHPVKHIIVNKKNQPILIGAKKSKISGISKTAKAVLIDFERTHKVKKPHNVTQFGVFIISSYLMRILKNRNIIINKNKFINLLKIYKNNVNKNNFNKITREMK